MIQDIEKIEYRHGLLEKGNQTTGKENESL